MGCKHKEIFHSCEVEGSADLLESVPLLSPPLSLTCQVLSFTDREIEPRL